MTKTKVRLDVDRDHAVITFRTEGGLNILSPDVMLSFGALVARIRGMAEIRTTVIRGEGKVFLAGYDVKVVRDYRAEQAREYSHMGLGILDDLAAVPSITVAAINGAALGGGLELALACDFRIAVKSAKVGMPEVSLGLTPGWGGIGRLTKLVGPARAKRIYLSGLPVSAGDGVSYGLIDEVVNSAEDLASRVIAFCRLFRRASPTAVMLAKRAARDMDDLSAFADSFETKDCREGIAAFLGKRPPSWMEQRR